MLDYDARDAKIERKLNEIEYAPPDLAHRVTTKALRALYMLGVKQAREELDWCQSCQSRGYVDHSGIPFGVHVTSSMETKKAFCFCKRGKELKSIQGKLGDWNNPLFGQPGFNPTSPLQPK
jgi:hypothetical protein